MVRGRHELSVVALVLMFVLPLCAAPSGEAELRDAYRQDTAAFNRGDVPAMMRDIDGAFVYRSTDSAPQNRAAYELTLKEIAAKKPTDVCTIKSVSLHPDTAEVVVTDVMTLRGGQDGHTVVVETSTNRGQSWRHTSSGWKIVSSTELERHYTVNGKPSSSSKLPRM